MSDIGHRRFTDEPGSVDDAKSLLRARLRAVRRLRHPAAGSGEALAQAVLALPEVDEACRRGSAVAAYVSGRGEPPTAALVALLAARGARVLLPVVRADLDLDWAWDDGTRVAGIGPGVLEPDGPRLGAEAVAGASVVVVPALAVDRAGRRLGQGGASYDRALARVAPGTLVVALLHDDELLDEPVPVDVHDRSVGVVVTVSNAVAGTVRMDPAGSAAGSAAGLEP